MSLNYDLSKIKDKDTLCVVPNRLDSFTGKVGPGMNPLTESLIFACMAIGIGTITEGNAPLFYKRLHQWELIVGKFLGDRGFITLEQVQQHMGLRTNVFPQVTHTAFEKKLLHMALDKAEARARNEETERKEQEAKRAKRAEWRNKDKEKSSAAK